jgi:hypothetical protein
MLQCFAQPRDVAVAEYCEHAGKERQFSTFDFRLLCREVAHECLRHGQSNRFLR